MSARLLIVEDDEAIRDVMVLSLERAGYAVTPTGSAEDGFAALAVAPYDLILMDVGLPGMSGLEACQKIKADSHTAKIPVIMVTAYGHYTAKVRGLDVGADDYIVKPLQAGVFLARIDALLRRYRNIVPPS